MRCKGSSMPFSIITDSRMTREEALAGTTAPASVMDLLCLIDVDYLSFEDRLHRGQLVVHEAAGPDILAIFRLMRETGFPVGRVVPIVRYGWSDDASMAANNSSAFNYRFVAGTGRLSAHARGMAVDINALQNPVVYQDGRISPPGAQYHPGEKGVLTADSAVVREFLLRGWQWGGQFSTFKDYHHFECKV